MKVKGSEKMVETLNNLLANELTGINQYMVHSEMCANWEYKRLHERIEKRAIDEMKHAEKLIARILFLEGLPIVSNLEKIHIGSNVEQQLAHDRKAEEDAILLYRSAIRVAYELDDHGTRELLENILEDEEEHIDLIEAQLDQINQMGVSTYLSEQIRNSN
jgi:bacterioferritin